MVKGSLSPERCCDLISLMTVNVTEIEKAFYNDRPERYCSQRRHMRRLCHIAEANGLGNWVDRIYRDKWR